MIDIEEEDTDEEVYRAHCRAAPRACHRFVPERVFDGRDGREAYMETAQQLNRRA